MNSPKRKPKRRNAPKTKAKILAAALRLDELLTTDRNKFGEHLIGLFMDADLVARSLQAIVDQ